MLFPFVNLSEASSGGGTPAESKPTDTGVVTPPLPAEPASDSTPQPDTFHDVTDLPDELQPRYKDMQADYTRKTQKIALEQKGIDQLKHRSELLENLVNHPDFQGFLDQLEQSDRGEQPGNTGEEEFLDPQVQAAIDKALEPLKANVQQQEVLREKAAFVTAYPGWEQHAEGMKATWARNPSMTMEDCYKLTVSDALLNRARTQQRRQGAAVETPGPGAESTQVPKVGSFADAVKLAKEQLGRPS